MFAFDLLHRQLLHWVLLGRKMPLIDTRLICVIPGDAKRREQSPGFQELRILPEAHDVGKHSPRSMIKCMPERPRGGSGADETPHFIQLGCALCLAAGAAGA